jgi:hypothetical protein
MWSPESKRRAWRWSLALLLVAVAAAMIVTSGPLPRGPTLLSLSRKHGVDANDLPAIALLLLAAWLVLR